MYYNVYRVMNDIEFLGDLGMRQNTWICPEAT